MALHRQTHLGHSTGLKSLTIVDFKAPQALSSKESSTVEEEAANTTPSKSFILNLPDELLVPIVELACAIHKPDYPSYLTARTYNSGDIRGLSLACKRIRRIAQPLLFKEIIMGFQNSLVPPSQAVIKLHRTLTEREDLRQHCRYLDMHIPDYGRSAQASYEVALDFSDWLTRTRCLTVHGGFSSADDSEEKPKMGNQRTWALLRRMAANFKNLEEIDISREGWGLYLPEIFKWLDFPNLKSLIVNGISKKHADVEWEVKNLHAASFTSLDLSDYGESPEATRLLIHWPAHLKHFQFGSFYNNEHIMDYPMFASWLSIHRDTLTYIDIGYLSRRGSKNVFDATQFPNLTYLKLSRWQMATPLEFLAQHAEILGPGLQTFAWDFSIYDQHSEGWDSFAQAEADWVRALAEAAVARKACLKMILIGFTPDGCWGGQREMPYPWDWMDEVRDGFMKGQGIELVYNEPSVSREEWKRFVEKGEMNSEGEGEGEGEDKNGVGDDAQLRDRYSDTDTEESEDLIGQVSQWGYQGEDIRGYFVKEQKST